jgi:hypothetical protein
VSTWDAPIDLTYPIVLMLVLFFFAVIFLLPTTRNRADSNRIQLRFSSHSRKRNHTEDRTRDYRDDYPEETEDDLEEELDFPIIDPEDF